MSTTASTARDASELPGLRRQPVQRRSRQRVDHIIATAQQMILENGLRTLNLRDIAERAEIPPSSVYQFFDDIDGIAIAVMHKNIAGASARTAQRLAGAMGLPLPEFLNEMVRALVDSYEQNPIFVTCAIREAELLPRLSQFREQAMYASGNELASTLQALGLVGTGLTEARVHFLIDIGYRMFRAMFRDGFTADPLVVDESIRMLTAYLEKFPPSAP